MALNNTLKIDNPIAQHNYNVKDCVVSYLSELDERQRRKLKRMLESDLSIGRSVAQAYNVPFDDFAKELKATI